MFANVWPHLQATADLNHNTAHSESLDVINKLKMNDNKTEVLPTVSANNLKLVPKSMNFAGSVTSNTSCQFLPLKSSSLRLCCNSLFVPKSLLDKLQRSKNNTVSTVFHRKKADPATYLRELPV